MWYILINHQALLAGKRTRGNAEICGWGGPVVNYDWNHDENLRPCMLQAYNQATECRHQKNRLSPCLLACLLAQRQSNEKTVAAGRCSSSSIPQNQYKWFSHMKGNIWICYSMIQHSTEYIVNLFIFFVFFFLALLLRYPFAFSSEAIKGSSTSMLRP